jgi:hypothetical protein
MKIIGKDNFDRDEVSDVLVAVNVSETMAPIIVDALNSRSSGPQADRFYKAVPDDYKLYEFNPG